MNKDRLNISFVGDLALNGRFCDPLYHDQLSSNIDYIHKMLGDYDYMVANWEAPIHGDKGLNQLRFPNVATTLPAAKKVLKIKSMICCLANNHFYDTLDDGFYNTCDFFDANNINFLGAGASKQSARKHHVISNGSISIALLNYVTSDTGLHLPSDCPVHVNLFNIDSAIEDIKNLRLIHDHVIIYMHWGIEYIRLPHMKDRINARKMIEAGAEMIIGTHSHCIQAYEYHEGKLIIYGLGNFLFGGLKGREHILWPKMSRPTSVISASFDRDESVDIEFNYFYQTDDFALRLDGGRKTYQKHAALSRKLKYSDHIYKYIYFFEMIKYLVFLSPFRFVYLSGGISKALKRINKKHFLYTLSYLGIKIENK